MNSPSIYYPYDWSIESVLWWFIYTCNAVVRLSSWIYTASSYACANFFLFLPVSCSTGFPGWLRWKSAINAKIFFSVVLSLRDDLFHQRRGGRMMPPQFFRKSWQLNTWIGPLFFFLPPNVTCYCCFHWWMVMIPEAYQHMEIDLWRVLLYLYRLVVSLLFLPLFLYFPSCWKVPWITTYYFWWDSAPPAQATSPWNCRASDRLRLRLAPTQSALALRAFHTLRPGRVSSGPRSLARSLTRCLLVPSLALACRPARALGGPRRAGALLVYFMLT